ncbi:hypothetical protein V8F20_011024 [Naviculisporaceae sp. PSN 640]
MATLDKLKKVLRRTGVHPTSTQERESSSTVKKPLTDEEYFEGFQLFFKKGGGRITYDDFIRPQISKCLDRLACSRPRGVISVLEIGPGPESILGLLPEQQRRRVVRYDAFEPKEIHASRLETWLASGGDFSSKPFPALLCSPRVHHHCFRVREDGQEDHEGLCCVTGSATSTAKYDLVIFCHSMYGMRPKSAFIEAALGMLVDHQAADGMVVVFHRQGAEFKGLVCHRMASFPTGTVSVPNTEEAIQLFSRFIAAPDSLPGQNLDLSTECQRAVCQSLGFSQADGLVFRAPEIMVSFTRHATGLVELTSRVPQSVHPRVVKNYQARLCTPAAVIRPTEVSHVQDCVRWAIKHKVGLTVIGGSHSDHCVAPNTVAIDMSAFGQVSISDSNQGQLVVAGAGATTGDIIRNAMAEGLTVPLGSRPSVGAGLWLQGGIGHLARLHGLACDAIVGAVLVGVTSGQILHVGHVPSQYRPAGSIRPDNESDMLWAIKGAGTNFGIVLYTVFKTYPARDYIVRNWSLPLDSGLAAEVKLKEFDQLVASKLRRNFSSDVYLFWETERLHLGVSIYQAVSSLGHISSPPSVPLPVRTEEILGFPTSTKTVNAIGLFDTDMYMSGMHGGHGGGKTYSFKRCVFLENIGCPDIVRALVHGLETRPSPLCYFHLLHGGGAVADVAPSSTAFGCRGWNFACVVTGVWLRQDAASERKRQNDADSGMEGRIEQWVYSVVDSLLTASSRSGLQTGVYPADLGPDPRDSSLAVTAFGKGPNRPRLARIKKTTDPHNVLPYACPLPEQPVEPKLIILVTGEHGAGKDFCAEVWAPGFSTPTSAGSANRPTKAYVASISDVTKREYAAASGADLNALLSNRDYKEAHRPALTRFFQEQVRQRPRLPEEHFLNVVYEAANDGVDVLLITGMRDEAPVAMFSHLVPDSRVIEVLVHRSNSIQNPQDLTVQQTQSGAMAGVNVACCSISRNHVPDLVFHNDLNNPGLQPIRTFGERNLLPLFHSEDLSRLESMIRLVPDFPQPGIDFRHVLGIAQRPGGLKLVTTLFLERLVKSRTDQGHDISNKVWDNIDAIVTCETGGFLFASPLAMELEKPLVLVRKSGKKLPPPTCSTEREPSHISHATRGDGNQGEGEQERFEMESDAIRDITNGQPGVLVVDDVMATGKTLCAVLRLLRDVGIEGERVSVIVVAEFPLHRGRKLLRDEGFGRVKVQSLLTFGGL